MRFSLYYPIKPYRLNQAWGIYNPFYQQFGFTKHNGVDLGLTTGDAVRAPFPGTIIRTGNQPTGGGIFISLLSDIEYTFDDGITSRVLADFLHNQMLIFFQGLHADAGHVIALGDNTGASTGPHCHLQLRRVRQDENGKLFDIDKNEANNSFDPLPYWNGKYAEDIYNSWLQKLLSVFRRTR